MHVPMTLSTYSPPNVGVAGPPGVGESYVIVSVVAAPSTVSVRVVTQRGARSGVEVSVGEG